MFSAVKRVTILSLLGFIICVRLRNLRPGLYSHSMVPGGLLVMS